MAQARRSSAEQSTRSDAHDPSEGQPTAQAPTAPSTSPRPRKQAPKGPDAATRKPRGAAASGSSDSRGEATSPLTKGARKTRAATRVGILSPANPPGQAPILSPGSTGAHTEGSPLVPDAWRLLTTPTARFHAWIATHASETAACDSLCAYIVEHRCSLLKFTKEHDFAYAQVWTWLNDDAAPARFDRYARARADRADAQAEEVIDIADEEPLTTDPETGVVTVDPVQLKRNQLRIDARKWHASKMNPRYADRVAVGGDPLAPAIQTAVEHRISFGGSEALQVVEEVRSSGQLAAPDSEEPR